MYQFACAALDWLGFAVVSIWTVADHAARLVGVGLLARLMWRAKDDDGSQAV